MSPATFATIATVFTPTKTGVGENRLASQDATSAQYSAASPRETRARARHSLTLPAREGDWARPRQRRATGAAAVAFHQHDLAEPDIGGVISTNSSSSMYSRHASSDMSRTGRTWAASSLPGRAGRW